jgi:hypothetical protein
LLPLFLNKTESRNPKAHRANKINTKNFQIIFDILSSLDNQILKEKLPIYHDYQLLNKNKDNNGI